MTFFFFRLLALLDGMWFSLRRAFARQSGAVTAGAGVQSEALIRVEEVNGVDWPEFPTMAHSFWRAQELTLFRRHRGLFSAPALDLGSGDGIFATLAGFPDRGAGIDMDLPSLAAAARSRRGPPPVVSDAGRLPVRDRRIGTCLSNSVLEHLPDLDSCLNEVARAVRPGGYFIFSMTLGMFTLQLRHLTGERDAKRWIETFGHFQEPDGSELIRKLESRGFSVEECIDYQPIEATAVYRFLVSPVFQFVERRLRFLQSAGFRRRLAARVARSISGTPAGKGACCFIVARKNLC
jgi:SAM-dependent methyltransferase